MKILKLITGSYLYNIIIFTIIMPLNGVIIYRGGEVLGIVLIVTQVPAYLIFLSDKKGGK